MPARIIGGPSWILPYFKGKTLATFLRGIPGPFRGLEIPPPLSGGIKGGSCESFTQENSREIRSEFSSPEGGTLVEFSGKIPALVGAARSAGDRHA